MPILHLPDVPSEVYECLRQRAQAHHRTVEAEALGVLQRGLLADPLGRSQAELLADLRRRSFTPPPGTPDSVEMLREDRDR
jgi:plasmid stability protein